LCFSLLSMQCPGCGVLLAAVFLIVMDSCMSGTATLLATRARQSRAGPCVECACPVALARQLENVGGRALSLPSVRQEKNVLTSVSVVYNAV